MEAIKLIKTSTGWNAVYSDPVISELFGTDCIPTPFTRDVPESMVRREIQRNNPDAIVTT